MDSDIVQNGVFLCVAGRLSQIIAVEALHKAVVVVVSAVVVEVVLVMNGDGGGGGVVMVVVLAVVGPIHTPGHGASSLISK